MRIDHQLAAPVAVRVLQAEQVLLGAMDGQRDGISSARACSGDHAWIGLLGNRAMAPVGAKAPPERRFGAGVTSVQTVRSMTI